MVIDWCATGAGFKWREPVDCYQRMWVLAMCCVFFFSSRRRHTRFDCDWSSDVCSSDLDEHLASAGCMTGKKFPVEKDYVEHGVHIARECARLDIGQGCVVRKGTVLAVEIGRASCRERV